MDTTLSKIEVTKKIFIVILMASPFLSGYIAFIKFEVAGVIMNLFRVILIISAIFCLILFTKNKQSVNPLISFPNYWIDCFFIGLIVIGVVHFALGHIYKDGVSEVIGIAICLMFFCVFTMIIGKDYKLWRFTINAFKYIGIIIAIVSCFELVFGFQTEASRYNELTFIQGYNYHPATSVFVNENNLSAFFLIICSIIIVQIFEAKKAKDICINFIELIVLSIPVASSDSTIFRLGIILIVISGIVLSGIVLKSKKEFFARTLIVISNVSLFMFVFKKILRLIFIKLNLFVHNSIIDGEILDKIATGDTMLSQIQYADIGTVEVRKNLFLFGVETGKEHPIIGYGPSSFAHIFSNNDYFLYYTKGIVDPHNMIVEILVQYGGILSLLFICICLVILIKSIMSVGSSINGGRNRWDYIIISIFMISFAVSTIMPSGFIDTPIYYIPLFIAASGYYIVKNEAN